MKASQTWLSDVFLLLACSHCSFILRISATLSNVSMPRAVMPQTTKLGGLHHECHLQWQCEQTFWLFHRNLGVTVVATQAYFIYGVFQRVEGFEIILLFYLLQQFYADLEAHNQNRTLCGDSSVTPKTISNTASPALPSPNHQLHICETLASLQWNMLNFDLFLCLNASYYTFYLSWMALLGPELLLISTQWEKRDVHLSAPGNILWTMDKLAWSSIYDWQ